MRPASPHLARAVLIAVLAALLVPVAGPPGAAARERYVLRVYFESSAERDRLLATLDALEPAVHPEGYVAAVGDQAVLAQLRADGYRAEIDSHLTQQIFGPWPDPFNGGYRTVDELYADMDALAAACLRLYHVTRLG